MNCASGNTRLARVLVRLCAVGNVLAFFLMCEASSAVNSPGVAGWLLFGAALVVGNVVTGIYALQQGLVFELLLQRTWRHVCRGLGFVSERTRYGCNPLWVLGGSPLRGYEQRTYPKFRQVQGDTEGFEAIITPFAGQTVSDYNDQHVAEAFSLAFHQPFCTFELAENGLIRLRAGKVPVPAAYDYTGPLVASQPADNTRVLQQSAAVPAVYTDYRQGYRQQGNHRQANVWAEELELLKGVPMARYMNGPCHIPIEGQHWFIASRTGGGKSSWIWSLVLGLEPAYRLGLVKFWGIDSKMIELAIGRQCFEHYADDDESSVELLEQCVADMHERSRQMQGIRRKFVPSVQTPLQVVVIDEMGYLAAYMANKKLRDRADTAVRALLAKGRAPGYAVVGATQDARVEVCGFRNQFSIRIAGGLNESKQVDMVLGEGMYEAGAHCDRIPLTEPGVAYVISETTLKPVLVRAAWCDDAVIKQAFQQYRYRPE